MHSVALGKDIQQWLIWGMEKLALETPPPQTIEMQAVIKLLRSTTLVSLLVDETGLEEEK